VHGGDVEEWIRAHAEGGAEVDLTVHRFAQRHPQKGARQAFGLRARDLDPRHGALEAIAFARQLDRHEWAAASGWRWPVEFEAKIGQHAAQSSRLALVTLLQLRKTQRLSMIEAVERGFDAR
jgi:hypothetical protein